MITHVFHLADLHIRAGNTEQSRFDEFKIVFQRFIQDISNHPAALNGNAIVVIAGDVFHHKLRIESPGLKLALHFFQQLGAICPIYIIRGNHDYRQDKPSEPDLIQSLMHLHNVHYIDDTGTFAVDNVGFGIVTVQDALQKGATSGAAHVRPRFPDAVFDTPVQHKIALFHGNIAEYPVDWIPDSYDVAMLGDIHLQQVTGAKLCTRACGSFKPPNSHCIAQYTYNMSDSRPQAYAGSLLQQDFGESLLGHGYLVWNLEAKTIDCYHLNNDHGFIIARLDVGKDAWDVAIKRNQHWQPLAALVHEPWLPKQAALKVVIPEDSDTQVRDLLKRAKEDFAAFDIKIHHISPSVVQNSTGHSKHNTVIQSHESAHFNTPSTWIEYVSEKLGATLTHEEWKQWFTSPESILLPTQLTDLPPFILEKIKDRNNKLEKKITEFVNSTNSKKISKSNVKLMALHWDWILCFKNNNWINFDDIAQHDVTVISAKNGVGKTSFMEAVCIALYGEGFPSRSNKTFSASIICHDKPKHEKAHTSIFIKLGDTDVYRIKRVFTLSPSDPNKVATVAKETTVDRVVSENNYINLYSGRTAVDDWVETCVGDIRAFLVSCMVTQHSDCDFFNMKPNDQKEFLDKALDIESATLFQHVLKEAKTAHAAIVELTEAHISGLHQKNARVQHDVSMISSQQIEQNIVELTEQLETLRTHLPSYDPKMIQRFTSVFDSQSPPKPCDTKALYDVQKKLIDLLELTHHSQISDALKSYHKNKVSLEQKQPVKSKLEIIQELEHLKPLHQHDIQPLLEKYASVKDIENAIQSHLVQKPVQPTLSLEIAKNVQKPSKQPYKHLVDDIGTLTHQLKQVDQQLMEILTNPPQTPSIIVEPSNRTREQILQEIEETCSERDLTILDSLLQQLICTKDTYSNVNKRLQEITSLRNETATHPYNSDCWACKQQPWKKHTDNLDANISNLQNEIKIVKKTMRKLSGCTNIDEFIDYIQTIQDHVHNIRTLESMKWLEFCDEKNTLLERKRLIETNIAWKEWKQALVAVQTYQELEDWNTEYAQLQDDLRQMQQHEDTFTYLRLKQELDVWNGIEISQSSEEWKILESAHEQYQLYTAYKTLQEIALIDERVLELKVQQRLIQDNENKSANSLVDILKIRYDTLRVIYDVFDGFKQWVYTEKILPCLSRFANEIVHVMCGESRPIEIVGKMLNNTLNWFLLDAGNVLTPIEKASGFQKFILGLGIRIAVGKFGIGGIAGQCQIMFIDEGFTFCDHDNLARVPMFLQHLLRYYKDGIILVTHLDEIKSSAVCEVSLIREAGETSSTLRVGNETLYITNA